MLKDLNDENYILIVNSHLIYNPKAGHLKLAHLTIILKGIDEI